MIGVTKFLLLLYKQVANKAPKTFTDSVNIFRRSLHSTFTENALPRKLSFLKTVCSLSFSMRSWKNLRL